MTSHCSGTSAREGHKTGSGELPSAFRWSIREDKEHPGLAVGRGNHCAEGSIHHSPLEVEETGYIIDVVILSTVGVEQRTRLDTVQPMDSCNIYCNEDACSAEILEDGYIG